MLHLAHYDLVYQHVLVLFSLCSLFMCIPVRFELWPTSRALDTQAIAKPSGNRSYSPYGVNNDCTVVLLPDGPTMPRWQEPTSPVHSSHFTGSWVAIQHRGEQSLERTMFRKIQQNLLPTLCPPRCWIHISGRPRFLFFPLSVCYLCSMKFYMCCRRF